MHVLLILNIVKIVHMDYAHIAQVKCSQDYAYGLWMHMFN